MIIENTIPARLEKIRKRMQEEQIDAYLVLSSDFHDSEYVGDYFKCREYISGFTGSAGTVLVMQDKAGLWTDGRYFLQAEKELLGSGITLFRTGEEHVPALEEYLEEQMPGHGCLGVDGRTLSVSAYRKLKQNLDRKQIAIRTECDFIGDIWDERPEMSCRPAWELDICYTGKTRADKLDALRKELDKKGADAAVISSLADIAWALNIRGGDIACTPVVLGFFVLAKEYALWFVQRCAISSELAAGLEQDGIMLRDYQDIYSFLSDELDVQSLYLDPDHVNWMLYEKASVRMQQKKIMEGHNITLIPKAVKNQAEIENMRKAHRKDAVACIRFIYWLKKQMCSIQETGGTGSNGPDAVTEISAAEKLEQFRAEQEHYLGPSFDTIAGYAQHGAVVHYAASRETDMPLKPESFLLADSGGHYLEGTTDITRTIALGPLTRAQKHHYTLVLKGNIRLASAKFRYGCTGISLDCLAREALWKEGLDYNHGTGHGVGFLLGVHEPPNCFRSAVSDSRYECMKLEPGMITSDEPGLYIEGAYGIRLENLIVCQELEKSAYGRFLGFETLTLVPFEREAVLTEELDESEREWLNRYHARIFEAVSGCLEEEEREWLAEVTAPL